MLAAELGSDFASADLSKVDMSDAMLGHAMLQRSDLTDAILRGAYIGGADFTNAQGLDSADVAQVTGQAVGVGPFWVQPLPP